MEDTFAPTQEWCSMADTRSHHQASTPTSYTRPPIPLARGPPWQFPETPAHSSPHEDEERQHQRLESAYAPVTPASHGALSAFAPTAITAAANAPRHGSWDYDVFSRKSSQASDEQPDLVRVGHSQAASSAGDVAAAAGTGTEGGPSGVWSAGAEDIVRRPTPLLPEPET